MDPDQFFYFGIIFVLSGSVLSLIPYPKAKGHLYILPVLGSPSLAFAGLNDDIRKAHPHFLYDRMVFEAHSSARGDVLARMSVRVEEAECSISMIEALFESTYAGGLEVEEIVIPPRASALGYTESPRG